MEGRQESAGPGGQIAWNLVITQKEQKTRPPPACSCLASHKDDLSVELLEEKGKGPQPQAASYIWVNALAFKGNRP